MPGTVYSSGGRWFERIWWLVLTVGGIAYLVNRWDALAQGALTMPDTVISVVVTGLLLAPLFREVSVFGLSLKRSFDSVKEEVSSLRNAVNTALSVSTTVAPQFFLPAPISDTELPDLEARVKAAVGELLDSQKAEPVSPEGIVTSPDIQFLFATRYHIESELRRIVWTRDIVPDGGKRMGGVQLLRTLAQADIISPHLYSSIREVYIICSRAIHAEDVSPNQIAFVRDVAPGVIGALKGMK